MKPARLVKLQRKKANDCWTLIDRYWVEEERYGCRKCNWIDPLHPQWPGYIPLNVYWRNRSIDLPDRAGCIILRHDLYELLQPHIIGFTHIPLVDRDGNPIHELVCIWSGRTILQRTEPDQYTWSCESCGRRAQQPTTMYRHYPRHVLSGELDARRVYMSTIGEMLVDSALAEELRLREVKGLVLWDTAVVDEPIPPPLK